MIIFVHVTQEIYPPRLSEFSFVTDEACEEKDILEQEVVSLKVGLLAIFNSIVIADCKVHVEL